MVFTGSLGVDGVFIITTGFFGSFAAGSVFSVNNVGWTSFPAGLFLPFMPERAFAAGTTASDPFLAAGFPLTPDFTGFSSPGKPGCAKALHPGGRSGWQRW